MKTHLRENRLSGSTAPKVELRLRWMRERAVRLRAGRPLPFPGRAK